MTTTSYEDVLKFWFGYDFNTETYIHQTKLWFDINPKKDEFIKNKFYNLFQLAINNEIDEWLENARGSVALIILFEQFSKIIHRNTTDAFKYDTKAAQIALNLVNNSEKWDKISLIEKYFVYLCLLHNEDIKLAKCGFDGIEKLKEICPSNQKKYYLKYFYNAKIMYGLLEKFGRYPYRNEILGRRSTQDELDLLKRTKSKFNKHKASNLVHIENSDDNDYEKKLVKKQVKSKLPPQRLLFLHGYRQSASKVKKRTRKMFRILDEECNASVYFLNGTHPYKSENDSDSQVAVVDKHIINILESQRVWYNAKCTESTYDGLEESIDYVINHIKTKGPYDGIIGFSQGSLVASIILKRQPNLFRYFISISGYKPKDDNYKSLYSIEYLTDFPSLHIFGKRDTLVDSADSIEFYKCFKNAVLAEHPAGHFAPDQWPFEKIQEFVKNNFNKAQLLQLDCAKMSLDLKIDAINIKIRENNISNIDAITLFNSNPLIEFYNTHILNKETLQINNNEFSFKIEVLLNSMSSTIEYDDYLVLIYLLLNFKLQDAEIALLSKLWLNLYLKSSDYAIKNFKSIFVQNEKWKNIISLVECAIDSQQYDSNVQLNSFFLFIVELFTNQLRQDIQYYDEKTSNNFTKTLTSTQEAMNTSYIIANNKISELALHIPRTASSINKKTGLARAVALKINPFNLSELLDLKEIEHKKMLCYNHYRKVLSILKKYHENFKSDLYNNPRIYLQLAKNDKKIIDMLLNAPISNAILNPVPEPVDVSSHEQMKPLYDWLTQKETNLHEDKPFLKGTVTSDGRLDLCKQVIGPAGIKPLLDALNENKFVDRLLLGNNIIGDSGGQLIADFIKSGKSPLTVWYIAGNKLTHIGIKPIADALCNDTQVTGLWLKRNPLKPAGIVPIGNLLRNNCTIQVLDLINCGLLDEGVNLLFDALEHNNTLKHLYLSANGITTNGIKKISEYLKTGVSVLETLFLGANRIGDEGAQLLSQGLKIDKHLKRINLSSSRIGALGMKYLVEAFENNSKVELIDVGFMRSSMDLGEIGNFIQDEGAQCLANLLRKNTSLRSLNITHNHITLSGINAIAAALEVNTNLIHFEYNQHSLSINEQVQNNIENCLKRNRNLIISKQPEFTIENFLTQDHVAKIYSVYRTH